MHQKHLMIRKKKSKVPKTKKGLNYIQLSYCSKCRKNSESKNPKNVGTKNGRIMFLSKCSLCNSKKSKLIKEQEA